MDKAEFTEIVRTYQKQLLVIAFHYCGNRDDAEDVVQDVFVRLRAPAPFTQIIDPEEVVALYSPDGEYPVE